MICLWGEATLLCGYVTSNAIHHINALRRNTPPNNKPSNYWTRFYRCAQVKLFFSVEEQYAKRKSRRLRDDCFHHSNTMYASALQLKLNGAYAHTRTLSIVH
jgi:hypothetical protein